MMLLARTCSRSLLQTHVREIGRYSLMGRSYFPSCKLGRHLPVSSPVEFSSIKGPLENQLEGWRYAFGQ